MLINGSNTIHRPNAGSMLGRRRTRWSSIEAVLFYCIVLTGMTADVPPIITDVVMDVCLACYAGRRILKISSLCVITSQRARNVE